MSENLGTLYIFHENGHWGDHKKYDMIQMYSSSIYKEIIHWNRVYVMQNGRKPIVPEKIFYWNRGSCKLIKFNKTIIKLVNCLLKILPTKWRRRHKRWFGY